MYHNVKCFHCGLQLLTDVDIKQHLFDCPSNPVVAALRASEARALDVARERDAVQECNDRQAVTIRHYQRHFGFLGDSCCHRHDDPDGAARLQDLKARIRRVLDA